MFDIGDGWRRLARIVAIAWVIWAVVLTIAIGGLEPFVLIFAAVPLIAWGLTVWKPGRATYTIFGAVGLLVVVFNIPFLAEDLAHPESAFGFNTSASPLLTSLLMILVGVAAWRSFSERLAFRSFTVAAGVFVIGLGVSIVAALGLEDDVSESGDVSLVAKEAEWETDTLSLSSPGGVFVENNDPVRHTFTVDTLGIEVELPANTARRVEIDAPAGTYEFICSVPGHESMKGTITIG